MTTEANSADSPRAAIDAIKAGLGDTGYICDDSIATAVFLAQRLEKQGVQVKLFEKDLKRCEKISTLIKRTVVVHADGTDQRILSEENVEVQARASAYAEAGKGLCTAEPEDEVGDGQGAANALETHG